MPGGKRFRDQQGNAKGTVEGQASSGSRGSSSTDIMGNLPAVVGTGEHQKPIMEAVLMGLRDISMDMQEVKGALYFSWELGPDSMYVTKGMEFKEAYSKECR